MHLISDFCNRISLASRAKIKNTIVKNSKIVLLALYFIYKLGYVNYFKLLNFKYTFVSIKYFLGNSVIRSIFSLSKPSLKNFLTYKKIQGYVMNNKIGLNGFLLFSTNLGLSLDVECGLSKCGGKAILAVH